jgi:hypothetical protein
MVRMTRAPRWSMRGEQESRKRLLLVDQQLQAELFSTIIDDIEYLNESSTRYKHTVSCLEPRQDGAQSCQAQNDVRVY